MLQVLKLAKYLSYVIVHILVLLHARDENHSRNSCFGDRQNCKLNDDERGHVYDIGVACPSMQYRQLSLYIQDLLLGVIGDCECSLIFCSNLYRVRIQRLVGITSRVCPTDSGIFSFIRIYCYLYEVYYELNCMDLELKENNQ